MAEIPVTAQWLWATSTTCPSKEYSVNQFSPDWVCVGNFHLIGCVGGIFTWLGVWGEAPSWQCPRRPCRRPKNFPLPLFCRSPLQTQPGIWRLDWVNKKVSVGGKLFYSGVLFLTPRPLWSEWMRFHKFWKW